MLCRKWRLAEQVQDKARIPFGIPPLQFADLNCDGALDGLVRLDSAHVDDASEYQLQAITLRDGTRLWAVRLHHDRYYDAEFRVGDIYGDKRPEVAIIEVYPVFWALKAEVRAVDGRTGKTRWTLDSRGWLPAGPFEVDRSCGLRGEGDKEHLRLPESQEWTRADCGS